jgi:hypothetical protein
VAAGRYDEKMTVGTTYGTSVVSPDGTRLLINQCDARLLDIADLTVVGDRVIAKRRCALTLSGIDGADLETDPFRWLNDQWAVGCHNTVAGPDGVTACSPGEALRLVAADGTSWAVRTDRECQLCGVSSDGRTALVQEGPPRFSPLATRFLTLTRIDWLVSRPRRLAIYTAPGRLRATCPLPAALLPADEHTSPRLSTDGRRVAVLTRDAAGTWAIQVYAWGRP